MPEPPQERPQGRPAGTRPLVRQGRPGLGREWAAAGVGRGRAVALGAAGEIVERRPNEDYRLSPCSLGLAEPTDAVDAAVQLAATRWGPTKHVRRVMAAAEVAVSVHTDGRRDICTGDHLCKRSCRYRNDD